MTTPPVATQIWDEVDSGPAICLADVNHDNPYRPCGKKLRPFEDEYGSGFECPKHGPMH